jgi:CubicO group peptidase (beta-lactamase class C family)
MTRRWSIAGWTRRVRGEQAPRSAGLRERYSKSIGTPANALPCRISCSAVSMAVIDDRQTTALTVVGVRNSLDRAAVDQQTIFGAASLSKPLFAYAVLQLVDAGKLAFDTPLSRHVPDYVADDPRAAAVTVWHVLSHTSGLPNWRSVDLPLKTYFPPGERFSYSGEGFVWLQRVVEAVTGESLNTTLRRLIFEPLGMHRSSYTWQSAFEANYADPHDAEMAPGAKTKPSVPNVAAS